MRLLGEPRRNEEEREKHIKNTAEIRIQILNYRPVSASLVWYLMVMSFLCRDAVVSLSNNGEFSMLL